MADKRISQLIERTDIANNDVVPIVAFGASTTNKATISSIQTYMQENLDVGVTSVGITLGSSGTDVNVTGSPITTSGNITINIPTASATNRGLLSSANWTTFNNKVSSVGLSMPSAFAVANSPITGSGTIAVTGSGTVGQYIRGDGSLADFPQGGGGGGSSVSYYLNGSVSQGTIGGIGYYEMNKVPVFGTGTDFVAIADGYLASFITDAGDPSLLLIPAGNWNFETYFSASSGGGSPTFYIELYKVNSSGTATLIASNSATPENIAFGTAINPYFSALAVPTTTLLITDRLALRYYVARSGRTITLHTENGHLCQIITTFTTGLTALNGLTAQVQNFATGTSGTDFAISSTSATHTFNLPDASATARGVVTTGIQTIAGIKNFTSTIRSAVSVEMAASGTALPTELKNINGPGLSSSGSNGFGFNNSNNIYFSGSNKGCGVLAFSNSGTQTYTLQDASGTLAFTSDISTELTGYVTLGTAQTITAQKTFTTSGGSDSVIISTTGAGFALDAIKAGNGPVIRVNKTSGTGNAMTVIGGNFEAPTIVKTGGTSVQYLMADGSVSTLTNPITGTLATGQVAFGTSANTVGGDGGFVWDNTNKRLAINITSPSVALEVAGTGASGVIRSLRTTGAGALGIGDHAGRISLGTSSGSTAFIGAQIGIVADTAWTAGTSQPSSFIISTVSTSSTTLTERWRITATGILQSNGAQTIQTSTGNLTLATAAGNGNIVLSPNGTGAVTLTGALNGTSATFTSSVTGSGIISKGTTLNNNNNHRFLRADNTEMGYIGWSNENTNNSTWLFKSSNGNPIAFSPDGSTNALTLATSNAATFSSSVTATSFSNAGLQSGEVFNATKSNAGYFVGYFQNTSATGLGLYIQNGNDNNDSLRIGNAAGTANNIQLFGSGKAYFAGNVGIGTALPGSTLEVRGTFRTALTSGAGGQTLISAIVGVSNGYLINVDTSNAITHTWHTGANAPSLHINAGGNVGIGTATPNARLQIDSGDIRMQGDNPGKILFFSTGNGVSQNGELQVINDGIATNTGEFRFSTRNLSDVLAERVRITSGGVLRIANLAGAGSRTVTADANGNLSASSDSSLKQEDTTHKIEGLAEILQLQPKAYKWLSDIEIRGEEAATEIGFFADEVNAIIPSAAPKGNDDLYGFYDRAVIAALVKAIQEQQEQIDSLKNQIK